MTATNDNEKDKQLWKMARKRVAFKSHLTTYGIVNAVLWIYWIFFGMGHLHHGWIPWPVWCTFGWGIGLAFHYRSAYGYSNSRDAIEREYEKLKSQRNN